MLNKGCQFRLCVCARMHMCTCVCVCARAPSVVVHILNPAFRRQKQVDFCRFKASLVFIVRSRRARATMRSPVSTYNSNKHVPKENIQLVNNMKMCSVSLVGREININHYYNKILTQIHHIAKIRSDDDSDVSIGTVRPRKISGDTRKLRPLPRVLVITGEKHPERQQSRELGERLTTRGKDTLKE